MKQTDLIYFDPYLIPIDLFRFHQ